MRIVLALLIVINFSCKAQESKYFQKLSVKPVKTQWEPIAIQAKMETDSMLKPQIDSIIHFSDSLRTQLFLANYKLEKIKYYLNIVNRKPSQIVFLKGWLNRVLK